MNEEGIWKIALPVPLPTLFDYLPPVDGGAVFPGARVCVPFGRRTLIGILAGFAQSSDLPRARLARVKALPDGGEAW